VAAGVAERVFRASQPMEGLKGDRSAGRVSTTNSCTASATNSIGRG
jgi:hypothetical protein